MRKRALLIALLLAAGGAAYYLSPFGDHRPAARPAEGDARRAAQPVLAGRADVKPMPVEIAAIGHVQPIASVAVHARTQGQIAAVHVRDGQEVRAGELLFTLDDREAQALLNQARGNLARDRAQLAYARKQVERFGPLAEKGFYPREQFEQAVANVAAIEGTIKADEAQIATYQTQLTFTEIRAPIDGRIGTINLKEGNSVQPNAQTPLTTINQMRPIYVAFSTPQGDLADIQRAMAGGPVTVVATVPGHEDEPQAGAIAYIENEIDPASGTISVKAAFDNVGYRLWPGQFVNVVVVLRVEPAAVVVPGVAVQAGQTGSYVFVVRPDSTVEQRAVTVDRVVGAETVIASGLRGGEQVVTTGHLRLVEGTRVEVRPPAGDDPSEDARS